MSNWFSERRVITILYFLKTFVVLKILLGMCYVVVFSLASNGKIAVLILLGYECHESFICPTYETNEDSALSFSNCNVVLCVLCGNVATCAEY